MLEYNKFKPVQLGNYSFQSFNSTVSDSLAKDEQYDSPLSINGKVRTNNNNVSFLSSNDISFTIFLDDSENLHKFKKMTYAEAPLKIWFVEKFNSRAFVGINHDKLDNYNVYYAYCSILSMSEVKINSGNEQIAFDNYQIDVRILGEPVKYLAEGDLFFIKYDDLNLENNNFQNNNYNFQNNTFKFAGINSNKMINFNNINSQEKGKIIEDNCCEKLGFFYQRDRFLKLEDYTLNETAPFYELILNNTNVTIDKPIIKKLSGINQVTSAVNNVNKIFISKTDNADIDLVNAMSLNESLIIENLKSGSKLKLTCNTTKCPKKLLLMSHKSDLLYNLETQQAINFSSVDSEDYKAFTIENLGYTSMIFTLSNRLPIAKFEKNQFDDIVLISNLDHTNIKTKIQLQTLPAFF